MGRGGGESGRHPHRPDEPWGWGGRGLQPPIHPTPSTQQARGGGGSILIIKPPPHGPVGPQGGIGGGCIFLFFIF